MIDIAILGFGIVGSGVAEVISENSDMLAKRIDGEKLSVKHILDLRKFPDHPLGDRVTDKFDDILNDESVIIVVETMGGLHPAYEYSKAALCAGKSVVTSNKELVATYGAELLALARENEVSYLFEASVGGGIPILRPMWQCLAANRITKVTGILNGTTNYILTKMFGEGQSFEDALKKAQELGYAERNPSADVEGLDTCRKISILASLAFGRHVFPDKVHCEGITKITKDDISLASSLGYAIKLIGYTEEINDEVYVITCPALIQKGTQIADVSDVYNGIRVFGNAVGDVVFYGRGAGKMPTASAVMADVLDIIRDCRKTIGWELADEEFLFDFKKYVLSYFVTTKASEDKIKAVFPNASVVCANGICAFITDRDEEGKLDKRLEDLSPVSKIRMF